MDVSGILVCCGCMSTNRKMNHIGEYLQKQFFSDIMNEVMIDQKNMDPLCMCWECHALLKRFIQYKHQVRNVQWCLKNNVNLHINETHSKLSTQKLYTTSYIPNTETSKEETEFEIICTISDGLKDLHEDDTKYDIKHFEINDEINNYSDDDDKLLINFSTKECKKNDGRSLKKNYKKEKKKCKKLKKQQQMKRDVFKEIELDRSEIDIERKETSLREDYTNSMFKCERCIISFPNVYDFNDHCKFKHEMNLPHRCAICDCCFASEVSYNYHTNKHKRRYECSACMERFVSRRGVEKHYDLVHCNGANLMYEELNHKKNIKDNGVHNKDHKEEDNQDSETPSFPCNVCTKTFRWKTSLRKHIESHVIASGQKRRPYCEPCSMSFSTTANLQKHVKTSSKHQIQLKLRKLKESQPVDTSAEGEKEKALIEEITLSVNSKRQQYSCDQCDRKFQWRGNLLRHRHSHIARASGELVCAPCDRTFSSIATYRQHLSISKKHISEDQFKFVCSDCGKRFVTKTRLSDHVDWEHLNNYVHKCTHCQKAFKSHTSLYLHKQVVHRKDSAEHLCDHCGKPFANQAKLRCHITALHSGETPYKCNICNAKFSWHSCLSRHVRRAHKVTAKDARIEPTK